MSSSAAAAHPVTADTTIEGVRAAVAAQDVAADVAEQPIPTGATLERVDGVAAEQAVGPAQAAQRVAGALAAQHVLLVIAGDDVGEVVAAAVDGVGAGQPQVLDVRRQRVGDAALDLVAALAGFFLDAVANVSSTT